MCVRFSTNGSSTNRSKSTNTLMPSLEWNRSTWGSSADWDSKFSGGDIWSRDFGNTAAMWYSFILPRISEFVPTNTILEIAPGYGRCTEYLLRLSNTYHGVDASPACVEACKERFKDYRNASFQLNDGINLSIENKCDFVFSYDSLVHVSIGVMESYLPQIVRLLSDDGIAFIHHSNLRQLIDAGVVDPDYTAGARDNTVSHGNVAEIIEGAGGSVLIQEVFNSNSEHLTDCFTVFVKGEADGYQLIENDRYFDIQKLSRTTVAPYTNVFGNNPLMTASGIEDTAKVHKGMMRKLLARLHG